mgnify:CR=1 FL=1
MKYALCFVLVAFAAACTLISQELTLNPDVKYGKLPNGMTYYVQKNVRPQARAELRLAFKAGSVLEDDDQQGLAHFVEHMLFEGTESYPGNAIDDYLQSIGVQFGPHLNAYTSFDETVYMIQTPTDKPEYLSKSLHIMEEWMNKATFLPEEIEPERKIVIEEWRLGLGAEDRMERVTWPVSANGSRYAERLPIGKIEVLQAFPREAALRFYRDWYRPDLAAIVVVGDVDVEATVKEIEKRFSPIAGPKNPRKREKYAIKFYDSPKAVVATDPEASYISLSLTYKRPHQPFGTHDDYFRHLKTELMAQMLTTRMEEYRFLPEPPFTETFAYAGNFGTVADMLSQTCIVGEGGVAKAMDAAAREHRRIAASGFTPNELETAKAILLNKYKTAYKERNKTESADIIEGYVYHFLEGTPAPGAAFNYDFAKKNLAGISPDELNAIAKEWLNTPDLVIVATGPNSQKSRIPSAEELLKQYHAISAMPASSYKETDLSQPIVNLEAPAGKVVAENPIPEINAVEWTLSNGAKVILKPTDFKEDEVEFQAYSHGGYSLHENNVVAAKYCAEAVKFMGAGNYNPTGMSRKLSGKTVKVKPYVYNYSEGMNGKFSAEDAQAFFELVHAYFVRPRRDEEAFRAWIDNEVANIINAESDPNQAFYDTVTAVVNNYHPSQKPMTADDFKKIKLDDVLNIYRRRFADASDYVFVFTGSFKPEQLKAGVEKHLASLPGNQSKETAKDIGVRTPKGKINRTIYKGTEDQAKVFMFKSAPFKWTVEDTVKIYAVQTVLDFMFTESMRKKTGGTYGTWVRLNGERFPGENVRMAIRFGCSPANVETLINLAENDLKTLCEQGPSDLDMTKMLATLKREAEVMLKENGYWTEKLVESYKYGLDPRQIPNVAKAYDNLTQKDLQSAAKSYFSQTNDVVVVRLPVKK